MGRFRTIEDGSRPFSEILEERRGGDRRRELVVDEIARLEGEARASSDPTEAALLQCQAEELRSALSEAYLEQRP